MIDLRSKIREVQDFPTPGVGFKDFTPLLADPEALRETVDQLATWVKEKDCDIVIGAEARGFILGAAIAAQAGVGFVPARRPGKLPPETISVTYALEYGQNSLELHPDLIPNGSKVIIHDDVLATGGTGAASVRLVERAGATVAGFAVLMELEFLAGRAQLPGVDIHVVLAP